MATELIWTCPKCIHRDVSFRAMRRGELAQRILEHMEDLHPETVRRRQVPSQ